MGIGKVKPQILNLDDEGKIEPFSINFAYTSTVQEYTVPYTGLYKLEVWGAQGGSDGGSSGGAGGYSIGYIKLKKNTILYVVNGGKGYGSGATGTGGKNWSGGYNGGGNGGTDGVSSGRGAWGSSGGGATHIALVTGLLKDIGKTVFDTSGLIVAGGGGGNGGQQGWEDDGTSAYEGHGGGSGGGLTGGNSSSGGQGATQTSGYAFGQGDGYWHSGGGGGYYGGHGGYYNAAGGGSGWITGVPEITYKGTTYSPSTSNGVNRGNGKTTISFITK